MIGGIAIDRNKIPGKPNLGRPTGELVVGEDGTVAEKYDFLM